MSKILMTLAASLFALSASAAYAPKSAAVGTELAAVAAAKADVQNTQTDNAVLAKKGGKKKKHPKHA